jgi:hypothetical protein
LKLAGGDRGPGTEETEFCLLKKEFSHLKTKFWHLKREFLDFWLLKTAFEN